MIERLRGISFFAGISELDLRQVAGIVTERSVEAGSVIVEEFTAAERFFIIASGKVEITKKFDDGESLVLSVQSNGDFFGEMALLDERPRSATARALEPTILLEISRADFETLLYKAPALAYRILQELSSRLRETGALLVSHLQKRNRQLSQSSLEAMALVIQAVERRDARAAGHSRRVMQVSRAIGRQLGVPEGEMAVLDLGSLFHDLGMLSVPEDVVGKPGPLTTGENQSIREHPLRSGDMVKGIVFLEKAIPSILSHHEHFDGSGYPRGLAGEEIPLAARIIAVADAFDALTRDRPFHKRVNVRVAVEEIRKGAGTQFDPKVVEAFRELAETGKLPAPE